MNSFSFVFEARLYSSIRRVALIEDLLLLEKKSDRKRGLVCQAGNLNLDNRE